MKEDLDGQRGKFYPDATFEEKVAKVLQSVVDSNKKPITEEQAREFVEGAESHGYEIRVYDHAFGFKKVEDGIFESDAGEDQYFKDLFDRCFSVKRAQGAVVGHEAG